MKKFLKETAIGCDSTKPLEWETMLITRAAWNIKPGGMLRTATDLGKKEIIKFI